MKVFDNLRANTALTWIAFDNNGAALGSLQALKNCVANGNQSLLSSHPLPPQSFAHTRVAYRFPQSGAFSEQRCEQGRRRQPADARKTP